MPSSWSLKTVRRVACADRGMHQNLTWDEDAQIRGVHPIIALRDFILDEESALYPRTLIFGYIEEEEEEEDMPDSDDLEAEEGQIADSDLADVVAQLGDRLLPKVLEVSRVLRLDTDWTKAWASTIVSGDLEMAACLLITLLPNLEKLRIIDGCRYCDDPPFYSTVSSILEAATDAKRDVTGLNTFQNLTEVGLHGTVDSCWYVDGDVGRELITLPSLRTVKGRYVSGESLLDRQDHKPVLSFEPKSNIATLEFHQSSIDMGSLCSCLGKIKALQYFIYDFCADVALGYQTWEPRAIVGILQLFAGRSLVHLELTGVTDIYSVRFRRGEPFIGSLRAFEVLETLRLETVMLHKEVDGTDDGSPDEPLEGLAPGITENDWAGGLNALVEPERLVDILPASAKRLRLVGGLSYKEANEMLENLVELKDERIPNLRRIFFEDVNPSSEISSVCENAGVKAKFCQRV